MASKEIFLLRNLSRGKGIGFFESEGFFPNFILWIKEGKTLRIVFVEPHGMRQEKPYWSNEKLQLHKRLQDISKGWKHKAGMEHVLLDAFIVSATPYDTLRDYYDFGEGKWSKEQFVDAHILFFEDEYVGKMFS